MASVRDIKKDINYLTYEVLSDCMIYKHVNNDNKEDTDKIMKDVIAKRQELIKRVNQAKREEDKKEAGKEFKNIMDEMMKMADDSFKKLSEMAK